MRPVIGVSTRQRRLAGPLGELPTHTVGRGYTDSLVWAGGIPVLLAPLDDERVGALLPWLDGLVLTGGEDLDPARHQRRWHPSVRNVDPDRDSFELALAGAAAAERLPLLGICRGAEVANVALGGDLVVDIPTEVGDQVVHRSGHGAEVASHRVRLDPGSRLGRCIGAAGADVKSSHHQAARRLGAGLRAVGWADDGVVEAIESVDDAWPFLGVQWHPELHRPDDLVGWLPFEVLVSAAAMRQDPREQRRPA